MQDSDKKNFEMKTLDNDTIKTPFDLLSIMMYGPDDFGVLDGAGERLTTIESLVPGVEIR